MRVNDGSNIYVENYIENTMEEFKQYTFMDIAKLKSRWELEFEKEKNRFTLKFNKPESQEYNNIVVIDRRQSVKELKDKISKILGIDMGNLIMRRGGIHGVELVDLEESVKSAHLYNLACVYVEKGLAISQNENRIELYLADPPATDSPDNVFNEFKRNGLY